MPECSSVKRENSNSTVVNVWEQFTILQHCVPAGVCCSSLSLSSDLSPFLAQAYECTGRSVNQDDRAWRAREAIRRDGLSQCDQLIAVPQGEAILADQVLYPVTHCVFQTPLYRVLAATEASPA